MLAEWICQLSCATATATAVCVRANGAVSCLDSARTKTWPVQLIHSGEMNGVVWRGIDVCG